MDRRHFLQHTGAAALAITGPGLATAQASAYPGPVKVVLPLQAASASDVAVRLMVERLAPRLGTSMLVENVAAAAGLVGLEQFKTASGDTTSTAGSPDLGDAFGPGVAAVDHGTDVGLPFCGTGPDIGAVEMGC